MATFSVRYINISIHDFITRGTYVFGVTQFAQKLYVHALVDRVAFWHQKDSTSFFGQSICLHRQFCVYCTALVPFYFVHPQDVMVYTWLEIIGYGCKVYCLQTNVFPCLASMHKFCIVAVLCIDVNWVGYLVCEQWIGNLDQNQQFWTKRFAT